MRQVSSRYLLVQPVDFQSCIFRSCVFGVRSHDGRAASRNVAASSRSSSWSKRPSSSTTTRQILVQPNQLLDSTTVCVWNSRKNSRIIRCFLPPFWQFEDFFNDVCCKPQPASRRRVRLLFPNGSNSGIEQIFQNLTRRTSSRQEADDAGNYASLCAVSSFVWAIIRGRCARSRSDVVAINRARGKIIITDEPSRKNCVLTTHCEVC